MAIYARTPKHINDAEYLTADSDYRLTHEAGPRFWVLDDEGDEISCLWEGCAHLSGGEWTRVEK